MSAPEQRTTEVIVGLQRLKTIMERNGISSIIPMIGNIEQRENNHLVQTYQEVTKTITRLEHIFNVSAAELRDADDQKRETNPFTVYVVHGDGGERSRGPEVGYFSQRKSALEFSKGKGWYGTPGEIIERMAVKVGNKTYILNHPHVPVDLDFEQKTYEDNLRKSAAQKLSDEECRVLGISKVL